MYSVVIMPNNSCNYCKFEQDKLKPIIDKGSEVLPEIKLNLEQAVTESDIVENLYILDRMLDNGFFRNSILLIANCDSLKK